MEDGNSQQLAYKNNRIIYLGDVQIKNWDELSPNQLKIAMFSAAKVKPEDTCETRYAITFKEFADLCKFDEDTAGGKDYKRIYREASKLSTLGVDIIEPDGDLVRFNWLNSVRVSPKKGTVTYKLDEALLPFYKTMKGSFAIINLLDYMPLRGRYALLLYEFLAMWQNKGKVYQTIEQLRAQLRVPEDKYNRIADFMRRVVDDAVNEINEKAQYSFNVRMVEKRGKRDKVEGITFYIDPIKRSRPTTENQDTIDLLIGLGIDPAAAKSLANTYSKDRILANVSNAKQKKVKTTLAATVCAAIKDDYAQVDLPGDIIKAQRETTATVENLAKADCPHCGGTGFKVRYLNDEMLPLKQRKLVYKCDCITH